MPSRYRFGRFEMLPGTRQLLEDGAPVALGARAFDLLLCLIEHSERVVDKHELMQRVWAGTVVGDNNLNVQVSSLRKLLGPQAVVTVAGRGYRFGFELHPLAATGNPGGAVTQPSF
ncbi:MAG: winged helix-turn-helix domain-containing protein, partial [Burkholderiaceae bacterium]